MVRYADPVVVNHGVLCCTSGRESRRVMLSQWLRIMLCYAKQVVVNNGESCCANVVNHVVLCLANGCE